MSGRQRLGGTSTSPSAYGADTRADLNSLSAGSSFKRSEPLQTVFDVTAVLFGFLFVTVTGLGLAFGLFVLLFVRIP